MDGLEEHNKRMKVVHESTSPIREVSSSVSYCLVAPSSSVSPQLKKLDEVLTGSRSYEPIQLNDYSPDDARKRYNFLQCLKCGLSLPIVHLTYKAGNNVGDVHYIWHGNTGDTDVSLLEQS